jgi:hypothetical protein
LEDGRWEMGDGKQTPEVRDQRSAVSEKNPAKGEITGQRAPSKGGEKHRTSNAERRIAPNRIKKEAQGK